MCDAYPWFLPARGWCRGHATPGATPARFRSKPEASPGEVQAAQVDRAEPRTAGAAAALAEVKYEGWVTTEISGGDAAYLKDVVARLDRILAGQKPFTPPA